MTDTLRNGLVAFAMAAAAVIALSLVVFLATDGDNNTTVGEPTSVTPAALGATQTPILSPTPTP